MINANKGEWSEMYVLLRLLDYKKLFASDENTRNLENTYFPINKIFREEAKNRRIEFYINNDTNIEIYLNDSLLKIIDSNKIKEEADYLYEQIKLGGQKSAFPIERTEKFMQEMGCLKLSAPSTNKTDITMQVHDIQTGIDLSCGFSIKSLIGSAPTLLNASGATNFIYEVTGLSDNQMYEINNINSSKTKILDRMNKIFEKGCVNFRGVKNKIFSTNLLLIDSRMEELMGEFLLISYRDNINDCKKVLEKLEQENPLKVPRSGFYEFKFKKFLCSVALGMMPSKEWNGQDEANGGYIIVTTKGEVLGYHIYNRDSFEKYLLNNTKLERGSTSKHKFASLYKLNGNMFINLNLQVRFI